MADDNPKKVVLVVDDAPANIQVLSAILKEQYKVKAATSGEKALKIATSASPPDIILLDILMPEMDGFEVCEVCRQLKASDVTRAIPVVFVSGADTSEDKEKGLALGAVEFLTKPVDPGLVHACLANVLD